MAWTRDTLDYFQQITKFDYTQYLTDFYNFNTDQKRKIYDYYEGVGTVSGEAFSELDRLRSESRKAIDLARINKESFNTYDGWELLNELEDIDRKLFTIFNSSKFLRSAIATGDFSPDPLIEITLGSQQTLESLSRRLNSTDPDNSWTELFLNNQLTEEDYSSEGGALLKVTFKGADPLFITSVVDNINTAEKTFGLDIQDKLEFDNDDLKSLSYQETLQQNAKILSNLKKGDNPEFPSTGIDSSIVVGNVFGSVTFPVIFRQIFQTFATDDSFKSFAITDASEDGDSLRLTYQAVTRTDEIQEGVVTI